jgi:hypothetical protein
MQSVHAVFIRAYEKSSQNAGNTRENFTNVNPILKKIQ